MKYGRVAMFVPGTADSWCMQWETRARKLDEILFHSTVLRSIRMYPEISYPDAVGGECPRIGDLSVLSRRPCRWMACRSSMSMSAACLPGRAVSHGSLMVLGEVSSGFVRSHGAAVARTVPRRPLRLARRGSRRLVCCLSTCPGAITHKWRAAGSGKGRVASSEK